MPPRALGLSPLTPAQAHSLAACLSELGHSPASVGADQDTAAAFAEAWQRRTGVTARLRDVRVRLYRLGTLTPPDPRPEGRARLLDEGDLGQAAFWCGEFAKAVGEDVTVDTESWASTRYADKRYTLCEAVAQHGDDPCAEKQNEAPFAPEGGVHGPAPYARRINSTACQRGSSQVSCPATC
ncbi:hypothetical protein ACFV1A_04995 [Streptomyces seoulensis]|uniref:hypothetical protein n=1 Tax=Streptomyces seoulensis TaxID=73044 RepID=UPI00369A4C97